MEDHMRVAFLICGLMGCMSYASAQSYSGANGVYWNNPISGGMDRYMQAYNNSMNQMRLQTHYSAIRGHYRDNQSNRKPARSAAARTTFKLSTIYPDNPWFNTWSTAHELAEKALSKEQSIDDWAANETRRQELEKNLTEIFKAGLNTFQAQARAARQPNDLVYTATRCIALNYALYAGKPLTAGQMAALRAHVRNSFDRDMEFRKHDWNDAWKQDLHEKMVIPTMMAQFGYAASVKSKNAAAQQGFRRMAAQNLQKMLGAAPEQVTFTNTAVVIK
jgi:hypothetical protein